MWGSPRHRKACPSAMEGIPSLATALIGAATVLRVAAAFADAHSVALLILAAACWSGGFVATLWLIQRCALVSAQRVRTPGEPRG